MPLNSKSKEVIHYTGRAAQMNFRGILFSRVKQYDHAKTMFVSEIKWRLRINDAETSSNFGHKLHCRSVTKSSTNLQAHENSFEDLAKFSEAHSRTWRLG